jgi:hypothetical protein
MECSYGENVKNLISFLNQYPLPRGGAEGPAASAPTFFLLLFKKTLDINEKRLYITCRR